MKFSNVLDSLSVSPEKQKLLENHIFYKNLQRCKLFAKIVILFEMILICMNVTTSYVTDHRIFVFTIYLLLYTLLLTMSIAMLFYMLWFEKKRNFSEQQFKWFRFGLLCFVCFFLVWGSVVTLVDQKVYGHVMAFVVNIMCVSILFLASNRTMIKLYVLPISVLFIGLPFFQPSMDIVMGHYINLVVFLFFCWLASRMLYNSYASNFFNEMLLKESNHNLALKMEENLAMNEELKKANERLRQLTLVDELTKIPNRRGFQQYIQDRMAGATEKRAVSLMMLDIDSFKLFNDNYGHLEGDRVIQTVARTIQQLMESEGSILSRFGGEEFVVAVFDWEREKVYQFAEKIRKSVYDTGIVHEFSPVTNRVTVSIGVDTGDVVHMLDIEGLLENADNALYEAKKKGRNRVEVFAGMN
ncbi:GGDEF domain-containing protein [Niallia oryzisoli]|uniref:GGDEF domain-containing protein n=1 Tax=Niallia oryzisoli TaxID=1737571 RepID=UPI00373631F3